MWTVEEYLTSDGRSPFGEWIEDLRDQKTRARIRIRLRRLSLGNFGECRSLGGGLHELRIDYGPGFRVYFGEKDGAIILLLCGGDKGSQRRDINQARTYWDDFTRHEP